MATAGSIVVDLIMRTGMFETDTKRAEKRLRDMQKTAERAGKVIGTAIAAGVGVAVGALTVLTKNAIDQADAMRDMSIRLGESTETLSAYGYAASQTGTDIETLGKGLKVLSKNAADALNPTSEQAKIFDALGIKVTDATGKLKGLSQLVPEIADKFKLLEDGTTKAALAQALFGKAGLDLTEFLNQGSQGLDDFAKKAASLGIIIDGQTAAAADNFKDTVGDLHVAIGGLGLGIARELLPSLQEAASDMVALIKEGNLAADIASVLGAAFSATTAIFKGYTVAVQVTSVAIETLVGVSAGLKEVNANIQSFGLASGTLAGGIAKIKAATAAGDAALDAIHNPKAAAKVFGVNRNVGTDKAGTGQFANVNQTADQIRIKQLQNALANINPGKTKKTGGGKSDAERDAEQVARAIEQMTKAQQAWENELSQTGNPIADEYAARLREISEQGKDFAKDGVPADKIKAFTDEMTRLATTLKDADIAKFQKEFDEETATMVAQMQGPAASALQQYQKDVGSLSDELKRGEITLTEYNARLAVLGQLRDSPMNDVIADIREQAETIGMTNKQLEIYNNLKNAGVSAGSAWGRQIIAETEALQKQRDAINDQVDIMDGLRDSSHVFLDDLKKGEGIWDSLKDAAGNFADILYDIASRKLIEQIFGQAGTTGQGTTGGGWINSLFGLFSNFGGSGNTAAPDGASSGFFGFGGAKAGGGDVMANRSYWVGENGPERFVPRTAGSIVPSHETAMAGSSDRSRGFTQIIHYDARERVDNRSRKQLAQAAGMSASEAIRSNGG